MDNTEIKICPVCGEENQADSEYCLSCGAALDSDSGTKNLDKNVAADQSVSEEATEKISVKGKDKKARGNKSNSQETIKSLSTEKLFYIIFGLVLIGAFIVIGAGLFDEPKVGAVSSALQQQSNPHSGVDLNALNEINKLEETVRNNPDDLTSLLHLGHLLNDSGLKDKAIEKYKSYLEKDPKNADVWVDMGVCYFELGNNTQAISSMEAALKYQPLHQIANLNLGIVNVTAGNAEKAKEYWKKAVEINPSNEIGRKAEELLKSH